MSDPLAEWALVVVPELHAASAERASELARPALEVEARLEAAAGSMVEVKE